MEQLANKKVTPFQSSFDLSKAELKGRILEYGYGQSLMNAALKNHQIMSCDPLFPLPLPFVDFSFDLALCANFLFSNSLSHDLKFHFQVLKELSRVAKEVRVLPLENGGQLSPLIGPLLLELQQENYGVEIRQVKERGHQGNALLRVWAQQCWV